VRLGTWPFAVLWLSAFAFYLSFLLLLSALPIFARRLGASDAAVGIIMASFAVSSLLLRPPTGWAADRFGRRPFMLAGALIFVVATLAYGWTGGALGLALVRLLHGCGMGLYPTAASAMVADITPPDRRGEILGLYGAAGSLALAAGPILGITVVTHWGFTALFWIAGAVAAAALALTGVTGETLAHARHVAFRLSDAFNARALFPSLVMLSLMFTYGTQVAFLPLHADTVGVNPGVFFLVFALTTTVARGPAGRLSDRRGRRMVAASGLFFAAVALVLLAFSRDVVGLGAAGAVYGLAYGTAQPALMAWCVDGAMPADRGRAMGTLYTALEVGIAIGSVTSGLAVARWGFVATFLATAAVAGAGGLLALLGPRPAPLPTAG
jgi:MFS family permease